MHDDIMMMGGSRTDNNKYLKAKIFKPGGGIVDA
jgi:hypothetical protein